MTPAEMICLEEENDEFCHVIIEGVSPEVPITYGEMACLSDPDNDEFIRAIIEGVITEIPPPVSPKGKSRKRIKYIDKRYTFNIIPLKIISQFEKISDVSDLKIIRNYLRFLNLNELKLMLTSQEELLLYKTLLVIDTEIYNESTSILKIAKKQLFEHKSSKLNIVTMKYDNISTTTLCIIIPNLVEFNAESLSIMSGGTFSIDLSKLNVYRSRLKKLYRYLRLLIIIDKLNRLDELGSEKSVKGDNKT